MKTAGHQQGTPTWAELMTSDPAGAAAFYAALFGWSDDAVPIPGSDESYHMQMLGGDPVAAIGKADPDEAARGIPPHWGIYLAVDDVGAVVAKVGPAGGNVLLPPMDVMEHGRMAVISDPTGGVVSLWEAHAMKGFGRMREHGAVTWAELVTDNPAPAIAFYEAVLGIGSQTMPMPGGVHYTVIGPAQAEGAGIMQKTPEMGPMPNAWSVYFEVDDADATAAKATSLGGAVLAAPFDVPDVGRIAVLSDPQGAVFGVIKSAPMMRG